MKKILVVDDDGFIIKLVTSTLKTAGYEAYSARNAQEALEFTDKNSVDFVITDILMPPGDDGTKLIQKIKAKHPDIKVLAMTGGVENAVEDYVNYADFFSDKTLAKPFGKEELINAIDALASNA